MSLEDLLLKTDLALWNQAEKVTHFAYEKLGLSKWDLFSGCRYLEGGLDTGIAVYSAIDYFQKNHPLSILIAVLFGRSGYQNLLTTKKVRQALEQREEALAKEGTIDLKIPNSRRPVGIMLSIFISSMGIEGYLQDSTIMNQINILMGSSLFSYIAGEYFQNQYPQNPNKRRNVVKEFYQKMVGRLAPTPALNPVPVEDKYISYQTIDNLTQ